MEPKWSYMKNALGADSTSTIALYTDSRLSVKNVPSACSKAAKIWFNMFERDWDRSRSRRWLFYLLWPTANINPSFYPNNTHLSRCNLHRVWPGAIFNKNCRSFIRRIQGLKMHTSHSRRSDNIRRSKIISQNVTRACNGVGGQLPRCEMTVQMIAFDFLVPQSSIYRIKQEDNVAKSFVLISCSAQKTGFRRSSSPLGVQTSSQGARILFGTSESRRADRS